MPCPSVIYSGPLDGGYFCTPSPWTKCHIHLSVSPDDPFLSTFQVSSFHQPGFHTIWLHGVLINPVDDSQRLFIYKPYRPHHESTTTD